MEKTPRITFENCDTVGDQINAIVAALENTMCGEFIASNVLKGVCCGDWIDNVESVKIDGKLASVCYADFESRLDQ